MFHLPSSTLRYYEDLGILTNVGRSKSGQRVYICLLYTSDQLTEEKLASSRGLNELAKQRGESLAQMALKWVLKDHVVTSVLTVSYTHLDVYKRQI